MNAPITPEAQAPLELEPPRDIHPTPNLSKALLAAQRKAVPLDKDGHNKFHGYDYTSSEAMIDACRQLLHEQGITARRGSWTWAIVDKQEAVVDQNGQLLVKPCLTANVQQTFELQHAESGEKVVEVVQYPAIEEKGRPMDKGVAGALTVSWSYWLRDQLMIPRICKGQDDRDDRGHGERRQPNGGGNQQSSGGGNKKAKPQPKQVGDASSGNPVTKDTIAKVEYDKFSGDKKSGGGKWFKHLITTNEGVEYATFEKPIAQAAKEFEGTGEVCWIEYTSGQHGHDLQKIKGVQDLKDKGTEPKPQQLSQEEPGANG